MVWSKLLSWILVSFWAWIRYGTSTETILKKKGHRKREQQIWNRKAERKDDGSKKNKRKGLQREKDEAGGFARNRLHFSFSTAFSKMCSAIELLNRTSRFCLWLTCRTWSCGSQHDSLTLKLIFKWYIYKSWVHTSRNAGGPKSHHAATQHCISPLIAWRQNMT